MGKSHWRLLGPSDLPRRAGAARATHRRMLQTASPGQPTVLRENAGLAIGLLGVIIFGGTLPATRVALGAFDPLFITFGRAALASAAAATILILLRRRFPRGDLGALLLAGVLLVFAFPLLSSLAMQTVPAAHGAVVLGILPLATSIFAALDRRRAALDHVLDLRRRRRGPRRHLRPARRRHAAFGGDLWLFLAAVLVSLGYVISGRLSRRMPGWEVICWALIVTAPFRSSARFSPGETDSRTPRPLEARSLPLSRPRLDVSRLLRLECRPGDGRHCPRQPGAVSAGLRHVAISALLLGETVTGETLAFALAVMVTVMVGRWARVAA